MFKLFHIARSSVSTRRQPAAGDAEVNRSAAPSALEPLESRQLLSAVAGQPGLLSSAAATTAPLAATAVSLNPAAVAPAGSIKPTATIVLPSTDTHYQPGATVHFSGFATGRHGKVRNAQITWTATLFADGTSRLLARTTGERSGSFVVPETVSADPAQFIRVTLTVRDGKARDTQQVNILPRLADLSVNASFTGLSILVDGAKVSTPTTVSSAVGGNRVVSAPRQQVLDDVTYVFDHWSDNGARTHTVAIGVGGRQLIAIYRAIAIPRTA